jgi:hypothetical protein
VRDLELGGAIQALFDMWLTNVETLRAALGDQSAADLLDQARTVGPTLSRRTGVLYAMAKHRHPPAHRSPSAVVAAGS